MQFKGYNKCLGCDRELVYVEPNELFVRGVYECQYCDELYSKAFLEGVACGIKKIEEQRAWESKPPVNILGCTCGGAIDPNGVCTCD